MHRIRLYPTTPEQRRGVYADVENLLSPGFLACMVRINGVSISLRSFYPSDIFMLQHRVGGKSTDLEWRVWCLASCTWMINGQTILGEPNVAVRVAQTLRYFPSRSLDLLFSQFMGLVKRMNDAMEGLEAYCYEESSRTFWRQVGRRSPVSVSISGVPGVDHLGSNHIQRMWLSYNSMEDDRISDEMAWSNAKLIASAHSPKGVQKLDQHDKNRREEETARRQVVLDKFFYYTQGIITKEIAERKETGFSLQAKSKEQLEDEMRRWVAGEKDEHDLIVENYKNRIKQRIEDEKQQRHEQLLRVQQEMAAQGEEDPGPLKLVGYTVDQVGEIMSQQGRIPGVARIQQPDARDYIYDKWLERRAGQGMLQVDGEQVTKNESMEPIPEDLNQQIAKRRVTFGSKE